jgi:hypothetical protein
MKRKLNTQKYKAENPRKAKIIKKAVKEGAKQYAETFRRLAST